MIISRWIRCRVLLALFLWCTWPTVVLPQSAGANFKIAKDIFDSGGNPSRSTNFKLNESMGFPLETGRIESATFKLEGGFHAVEKPQPAFASVSGRVVDYQGQDPVIGAKIIIIGVTSTETATDSSGRFTLKTLPVGTQYALQPKHPGMFFQPPSREYSPLNNDQLNQDFTGSLYGDVSGNDEVRAFDASVALRTEAFLNEGSSPLQILNEPFAHAASPKSFYLWQNYPNPFLSAAKSPALGGGNPATMIQYQIPAHGNQQNDANSEKQDNQNFHVRLQVYNLLGAKVRTLVDEFQQPGNYRAIWDGADDHGQRVTAGVYL